MSACSKDKDKEIVPGNPALKEVLGSFKGTLKANVATDKGIIMVSLASPTSVLVMVKQNENYSIPTEFTISVIHSEKDGTISSIDPNITFIYSIKDKFLVFSAAKNKNPDLPTDVFFNGTKQ